MGLNRYQRKGLVVSDKNKNIVVGILIIAMGIIVNIIVESDFYSGLMVALS